MGCDIHLYKEKKINGVWVTADSRWVDEYDEGVKDVPYQDRFTNRDYNLFGAIAGVRHKYDFSLKPRGLPFNACDEVKTVSDQWGRDGHSHSHLTLSELKDLWLFLSDKTLPISGMKHKDELAEFRKELEKEYPDYNKLYPYCQGTNHRDYEDFKFDLQCTFILDGIKQIIELFDGVDGDDHRVVFWFDN